MLIFLLSLISCETILEKIECLTKSDKLMDEFVKITESIKTRDIKKIVLTVLEAYFKVKDDVKKCLNEEKLKPAPNLRNLSYYNPIKLEKCITMCGDKYYDYKCVKKCHEKYGDGTETLIDDILFE